MSRRHGAAQLIELRGVSRSYSTGFAVRALDLAVPAGQFVAIVGESGSGKTTTLKMTNRLLEPDAGEVLIDGQPTRTQPPHLLRRRIGYVFQRIGLFPHLTVAENIGITPQLLEWPREKIAARVAELLTLVNLPLEFAARFPSDLSGGQRQRVGVARALAARPVIMLMDEPFGALDPLTRDALGSEYRRLHEQMGLTTLMVTHSMQQASNLGDRLIMMHRGSVLHDFSGAEKQRLRPADLLARFESVRRAELLDESAAEMLRRAYV